ncbi:MAG: hypothetical protein JXB34_09365 [Bacteroidales bacterium]|nr:hypothetical protein [Bacteroidales bacterium]
MKQLFLLSVLVFILSNCKDTNQQTSAPPVAEQLFVYKYKVTGLNDTVVSDSVWKMIFTIEGIEEMAISKADSTVTFKLSSDKVTSGQLSSEIENRGARVLQTLN